MCGARSFQRGAGARRRRRGRRRRRCGAGHTSAVEDRLNRLAQALLSRLQLLPVHLQVPSERSHEKKQALSASPGARRRSAPAASAAGRLHGRRRPKAHRADDIPDLNPRPERGGVRLHVGDGDARLVVAHRPPHRRHLLTITRGGSRGASSPARGRASACQARLRRSRAGRARGGRPPRLRREERKGEDHVGHHSGGGDEEALRDGAVREEVAVVRGVRDRTAGGRGGQRGGGAVACQSAIRSGRLCFHVDLSACGADSRPGGHAPLLCAVGELDEAAQRDQAEGVLDLGPLRAARATISAQGALSTSRNSVQSGAL